MCVFRENTEDIYAGIEWEAGTPEAEKFYRFLRDDMGVTKVRFPETSSFGVKPVSREGTEPVSYTHLFEGKYSTGRLRCQDCRCRREYLEIYGAGESLRLTRCGL